MRLPMAWVDINVKEGDVEHREREGRSEETGTTHPQEPLHRTA